MKYRPDIWERLGRARQPHSLLLNKANLSSAVVNILTWPKRSRRAGGRASRRTSRRAGRRAYARFRMWKRSCFCCGWKKPHLTSTKLFCGACKAILCARHEEKSFTKKHQKQTYLGFFCAPVINIRLQEVGIALTIGTRINVLVLASHKSDFWLHRK